MKSIYIYVFLEGKVLSNLLSAEEYTHEVRLLVPCRRRCSVVGTAAVV